MLLFFTFLSSPPSFFVPPPAPTFFSFLFCYSCSQTPAFIFMYLHCVLSNLFWHYNCTIVNSKHIIVL
uniref:Uncharacterized protein n=1 Tax=Anguilla anguilla TaxID=7936 RepID=A0A0E9X7Y5_ANGAN